jgi:hypothetical protein
MSNFAIDPAYTEVSERMTIARGLWPLCIFRPLNPERPYEIVTVKELSYVVFTAALYRTPEDLLPAVGIAWEEIPGRTPYTKGSELMNAETSAWGRACIAAGIPSKKIASFEEVRNRIEPKAEAVAKPSQPVAIGEVVWDPWETAAPVGTGEVFDAWHCKHGERKVIEGEKNGRPYHGLACPKTRNSGDECVTNWFVLNAAGSWVPKLEAVK